MLDETIQSSARWDAAARYGSGAIAFHWIIFLLIVGVRLRTQSCRIKWCQRAHEMHIRNPAVPRLPAIAVTPRACAQVPPFASAAEAGRTTCMPERTKDPVRLTYRHASTASASSSRPAFACNSPSTKSAESPER